MWDFIEKVSVPCFYGFILLLQPLAAFLIGRFFTARQALHKRWLLGWLGGLAIFAAIFLLGWWGTDARVQFSRTQCGDYLLCCEYCGLAILFDGISGISSLFIFLATTVLSIHSKKHREADQLIDT